MDKTQRKIIQSTLQLYGSNPSIEAICQDSGITRSEFVSRYRRVESVYQDCYLQILEDATVKMNALPDLNDAGLEYRLSALIFILLDELELHPKFASDTFSRDAASITSPFQLGLRKTLETTLDNYDVTPANQVIFNNVPWQIAIAGSIVQLIRTWLNDDSENRERSIALIDRVVSLWAELLTSGVPQRAVELLRFAVEADYLPLRHLPFVGSLFRETDKEPDPSTDPSEEQTE